MEIKKWNRIIDRFKWMLVCDHTHLHTYSMWNEMNKNPCKTVIAWSKYCTRAHFYFIPDQFSYCFHVRIVTRITSFSFFFFSFLFLFIYSIIDALSFDDSGKYVNFFFNGIKRVQKKTAANELTNKNKLCYQ